MEWVFIKMMLSLAAVLGLMFVLVFVLKRFVLPGRPSGTERVDIDILGQRSLGPKRSIVVVKVLHQVLVVGVTEQGMQVLAEQAEGTTAGPSPAVASAQRVPARAPRGIWHGVGSFADHLQAYAQTLVKR
jgi:flagellar biosynthetic protein FliO